MKNTRNNILSMIAITVFVFAFIFENAYSQDPWNAKQLMQPSELNSVLSNPKAPKYYVFSIGYQAVIKNSIDIGPGSDKANIKKLKQELVKLPKNANVVIYCGCCPFSRCPNVRPAFNLLKEMGFKNAKLLNLPQNIKVDWIDKGYAVKK